MGVVVHCFHGLLADSVQKKKPKKPNKTRIVICCEASSRFTSPPTPLGLLRRQSRFFCLAVLQNWTARFDVMTWPPPDLTSPLEEAPSTSTQHLADANKCAVNTIDMGASVLSELGSQRDTLIRSRNMLNDTDGELSRGGSLISTMFRRGRRTKLILCVIVGLLLSIILLLLFTRFSATDDG